MIQNQRKPVQTPLGIINGRDAIYLDKLSHTLYPSRLTLLGKINTTLCDKYDGNGKWVKYEIIFEQVIAYKGWELDLYPSELEIMSSFDTVDELNLVKNSSYSKHKNYVFSTYDYIYEIIAAEFQLILGAESEC